jgi:hypothetical protein
MDLIYQGRMMSQPHHYTQEAVGPGIPVGCVLPASHISRDVTNP